MDIMKTINCLPSHHTPSHHTPPPQGYTRPDVVAEAVFEVRGGAHPVVSSLRQGSFIHNNCDMSDHRLWIITGPNMGGGRCEVLTSCLGTTMTCRGSTPSPGHLSVADESWVKQLMRVKCILRSG